MRVNDVQKHHYRRYGPLVMPKSIMSLRIDHSERPGGQPSTHFPEQPNDKLVKKRNPLLDIRALLKQFI